MNTHKRWCHVTVLSKSHQGRNRKKRRVEGTEGIFKGNYTRALSRGQNKLIGEFKMVAGDVISIVGWLWETHTFQQELKGVDEI